MHVAFAVSTLPDVPGQGRRTSVLTAVVDLDMAAQQAALRQISDAVPGTGDAVVVDLSGVFVSACAARLIVALVERSVRAGMPCAVVGAPPWMIQLARHLDVPPIPFHPTMASAVDALCARTDADGHRAAPCPVLATSSLPLGTARQP